MKYASNTFVEMQDQIIRPMLKNMYLYIGTDNVYPLNAPGGDLNPLGFDTSVAPVHAQRLCRDTRFYAVLGENRQVNNDWSICAPDNSGTIAEPKHNVPYGVTVYADANEEVIIGNPTPALNFTNMISRIQIMFAGMHAPTKLVVEWYDTKTSTWKVSGTYTGTARGWWFRYSNPNPNLLTRFKVSAPTAGRFQLAYIMQQWSLEKNMPTVIFNKTEISKVNIDMDSDLTSQSLPDYEMSVECLDINGVYTPDSEYWKKQFKEGTPVLFTIVSDKEGWNEYIDLFAGKLTEQPSYSEGKITFKIAVDWKNKQSVRIPPETDNTLAEGDPVAGQTFASIIATNNLFNSYDVFTDVSDRLSSVCNKYGEVEADEARQLIANALGCYITSDLATVDLNNANDIQYKPIDDYLTRYDQIKSALESKPKVGKIVVDKGNNTLSADYVDIAYGSTVNIADSSRITNLEYVLPSGMTSFGKTALVDAQSTNPDSTVTLYDSITEFYIDDSGLAHVGLPFQADYATPANPIVRFYKVNNDTVQETETLDNEAGEVYMNSNDLVTNSYIAGKVKRVAHLVSDISNQYEVDVIQDIRYDIGDVIRLETEKNVYKTCVITGLKFNLPGCHGHITCRKIFSLLDSNNVVDEPVGLPVSFGLTSILVTEASEQGCAVGIMNKGATSYIFILGVSKFDKTISGVTTHEDFNGSLVDLNAHEWKFACFSVPSSTEIITTARKIILPDYDYTSGMTEGGFGAISLLKALYSEQEMSAPVDYTCDWSE